MSCCWRPSRSGRLECVTILSCKSFPLWKEAAMVNRVRERRLESDFIAAQAVVLASRQRIIIEESFGSPPESYHFLFRCRCVSKIASNAVLYGEEHRVRSEERRVGKEG